MSHFNYLVSTHQEGAAPVDQSDEAASLQEPAAQELEPREAAVSTTADDFELPLRKKRKRPVRSINPLPTISKRSRSHVVSSTTPSIKIPHIIPIGLWRVYNATGTSSVGKGLRPHTHWLCSRSVWFSGYGVMFIRLSECDV